MYMDNQDNQINLNPHSSDLDLSNGGFSKLNADIQAQIINVIGENKEKDGGIIGKILGAKAKNACVNIVFIVCILMFIMIALVFFVSHNDSKEFCLDLIQIFISVISVSLGYIFGKDS